MGQVCPKHNEYYEKECRWCEPTGWFAGFERIPVAPVSAEDVNAHIAEAAASGKAQRDQIVGPLIVPARPANLSTYQYGHAISLCTIWKPHAAGYCGTQCTGIPGRTDWMISPPGGVTGCAT